jgi:hypothetical protein
LSDQDLRDIDRAVTKLTVQVDGIREDVAQLTSVLLGEAGLQTRVVLIEKALASIATDISKLVQRPKQNSGPTAQHASTTSDVEVERARAQGEKWKAVGGAVAKWGGAGVGFASISELIHWLVGLHH